eukprot:TRINITY_DN10175_c0_g2_i1.p1 TRINITY_DN10175_c0_g2~~TRINITY_DN10175_c0_g2_i1.p1  ORF type:complete len:150 (+),score=19.34 TRINITY_DN10175_c0_g2_i1:61-510(+)
MNIKAVFSEILLPLDRKNLSSQAAISMFVFGLTALVNGVLGILFEDTYARTFNLGIINNVLDSPLLRAANVAAFNMGWYYVLCALAGNKFFFAITVPFRCVTFALFSITAWQQGGATGRTMLMTAVIELAGALWTAWGLLYDRRHSKTV